MSKMAPLKGNSQNTPLALHIIKSIFCQTLQRSNCLYTDLIISLHILYDALFREHQLFLFDCAFYNMTELGHRKVTSFWLQKDTLPLFLKGALIQS